MSDAPHVEEYGRLCDELRQIEDAKVANRRAMAEPWVFDADGYMPIEFWRLIDEERELFLRGLEISAQLLPLFEHRGWTFAEDRARQLAKSALGSEGIR